MRLPYSYPSRGAERATLVVATFDPRRTWDALGLVHAGLRCARVDRVILLLQHPALVPPRLPRSHRVALVAANRPLPPSARWAAALALNAPHVLVIDDDLLLSPRQLTELFERLLDDPSVPHGVVGETGTHHFARGSHVVDVLCEGYAVTYAHLIEFRRLAEHLERMMPDAWHWVDHLLISRSGRGRPRIHDLGRLVRGRTAADPAVATHRRPAFRDCVRAVGAHLDGGGIDALPEAG